MSRALLLTALSLSAIGSVQAQKKLHRITVDTPSGATTVHSEAFDIELSDDEGKPNALMHAYGYFVRSERKRPVMFLWNGGPGCACALLHSGFAAPQVADLANGTGVKDNPLTMIDRCDLIYVDPVGTGFSRAIGEAKDRDFWNLRTDAQAAAEFVDAVLTKRDLRDREIYLCGESYGGIRVAAMLAPLRKLGVEVHGLLMISPALDTRTLWSRDPELTLVRRRVDIIPTLAALAVADGKREVADAHDDVDAVCRFAHGELMKAVTNQEVDWEDDDDLVSRVEYLTGDGARKLRMRRDTYDARMKMRPNFLCGVSNDVLHASIGTILGKAFGVPSIEDYTFMNRKATMAWRDKRSVKNGYPHDVRATDMIAAACKDGRGPRLFIASGWFDTVVPFAIARRLHQEGRFGSCEVIVEDYPGGHAVYVDAEAHREFIEDLRSWLGCRSV